MKAHSSDVLFILDPKLLGHGKLMAFNSRKRSRQQLVLEFLIGETVFLLRLKL